MTKKKKFNINNYLFKIVILDVFSGSGKKNENKFEYLLLVDDDNFIHDYKIQIQELHIKTKTTKSHEKTKSKNLALLKRLELIEKLNLKHKFGSGKKLSTTIVDKSLINKVNKWLIQDDWRNITFQNIEYIFTGSNAKGQGNGKGYFNTTYDNEVFPFGFLLQCLNFSKFINSKYECSSISYDSKWEELLCSSNKINFNDWISKTFLEDYAKKFKCLSNDLKWKEHKKDLENELKRRGKEYKEIDLKISTYRQKYITNIEAEYKIAKKKNSLSEYLYKNYFNIEKDKANLKFDKAHIKPVWLIKKEYFETLPRNENLLEQISDPKNFLPLSKNVHNLYDSRNLYWDLNGKLVILNDKLKNHEINGFEQISHEKVKYTSFYINEYIKKVVSKQEKNSKN